MFSSSNEEEFSLEGRREEGEREICMVYSSLSCNTVSVGALRVAGRERGERERRHL